MGHELGHFFGGERALEQIAGCDLIVDATADPDAFNLLASVCETAKKPMVWLEVFAGASSCRGRNPRLHRRLRRPSHSGSRCEAARNAKRLQQLVQEPSGAVDRRRTRNLRGAAGEGPVLVADDADVAVIAAYAARMAIDAMVDGNGFPHSMYVVSPVRLDI